MTEPMLKLDVAMPEPSASHSDDNITDWCLVQFREHYGTNAITKDDIWEYLYGVMHAPDWRERYKHDLQRSLPRVPFAGDFEAFRSAGRLLIDLHIGYETCPEHPVTCMVDGKPDEGTADPGAYRIATKMRWGRLRNSGGQLATDEDGKTLKGHKGEDRTVLVVNDRCRLVDIPSEAEDYKVSGRSPLHWAIESLRHKHDKKSGITDDPNGWHTWATDEHAFNLIRHLRRLVHVSVETARVVTELPASLADNNPPAGPG